MIFVSLSHAEAEAIISSCPNADVVQRLSNRLMLDQMLTTEDPPKAIWYQDRGDGLELVAIEYYDPAAATRAADGWWAQIQAAEPPTRKRV